MKMMKKLFALLLVLCMVFSLCACGGNSDTEDDGQKDKIENNQDDNDDADVEDEDETEDGSEAANTATFKVTVVDEGGNPVQGCMVQICKESCLPAITDANGVATFSLEIEDGHKLQVSSCPDGYVYEGEADIYLEVGQTEATITLKAVQ